MGRRFRQIGFTLIELMVALAVVAILLVMAIPSFMDFRQRAALRGGADQVVSFWADARFEALRRNRFIKVTMQSDVNGRICLGAANATGPGDATACDCFTAAACDVATFPTDQDEWRKLRVPSNPTLGTPDDDLVGVVVLDPKRGSITNAAHAGVFSLQSAPATTDYRLNVAIDRNGRAFLCEPAAAPSKLPQYLSRRC